MKHGVAFRKLSRPTAHRMLMLRNLVTSLFEHEQIKTTLPKAREAARLAEKIITLGKKGDRSAQSKASSLLLNQSLLPKLFGTFATRYAERPGGYTRIHKFGNREQDNAPTAILELVDNPKDIRFEMTSRAVGWELLKEELGDKSTSSIISTGLATPLELIEQERKLGFGEVGRLRQKTRWNLQKVLKFRDDAASLKMSQKASDHIDHLLAAPVAAKQLRDSSRAQRLSSRMQASPSPPMRLRAGQIPPGDARSALDLARGALGRSKPAPKAVLTTEYIFGRRSN
ncbi:50s ribosomal protein l17 [Moniliophthora roreri]|nr:50s ribosomal protein l17 [Moniliophthora roreri]